MRKAKKRVHPMPKLGWQDLLLYWTGFLCTGGGAVAAIVMPLRTRFDIAFESPDVIATSALEGSVHFLWLTLWLITMGCLIAVPYRKRYPVFGRKNLKYGPPAYPRVFPLLMKDKPQYWVSEKKAAFRRKAIRIGSAVMTIWLFIGIILYPNTLYHRADLYGNGTIAVHNGSNEHEYSCGYGDVEFVQFRVSSRRRSRRSFGRRCWYIEFVAVLRDGQQIRFENSEFRGDWMELLEAMRSLKQRYATKMAIVGADNVQKVVDYHGLNEHEAALLYELFDVEPPIK